MKPRVRVGDLVLLPENAGPPAVFVYAGNMAGCNSPVYEALRGVKTVVGVPLEDVQVLYRNIPQAFMDWRFCRCLCEVLNHLDYLGIKDQFINRCLEAPPLTVDELITFTEELQEWANKLSLERKR